MKRQYKSLFYAVIFYIVVTPGSTVESQSLDEELKKCSEITVSLIRLQCYDRLAKAPEVSSAEPAARPKRRSLFQRRAQDNNVTNEQMQSSTQVVKEEAPKVAQTQGNNQSSESFGLVIENNTISKMTSRVIGQFDGWTGDTVFRLENGQVWEQSGNGFFKVSMNNPSVTIEKGVFGGFILSVEGYNSRVKVKRVQ